MTNNLTISNKNQLSLFDDNQLSDLVKPLKNEIELLHTYVAGVLQMEDQSILEQLRIGEEFVMKNDSIPYDPNNVSFFRADGTKVGRLPEKDNFILSKLLEAGKELKAKITNIEKTAIMQKIFITVYMMDY